MQWVAKLKSWHWLLAIVVLGVVLRLIGFGSIPVALYWDEMAILNDALSIAQTGKDLFGRTWLQPLFISYGDFKLPLYIWLTSFFTHFTLQPLIAVRLTSFLAGLSMIPGMYFLVKGILQDDKKKIDERLPLLAAFVVSVLPWSLHFSRVGYEGHLGVAFLLWSFVCFFWSPIKKRPIPFFILSSLLGTLAVYSYFSVRFVWPVVLIGATVLFWSNFFRYWRQVLITLLIWIALLIPMYRADFYKASNEFRLSAANILSDEDRGIQVNVAREQAGNTRISRVIYNDKTFLARDLTGQYLTYLSPDFLFLSGDPNLRHGTGMNGVLWLSFLPAVIAGLLTLLRNRPKLLLWLTLWWVFAVLPAAVPKDVPHALRSLNALPVWSMIIAFGLHSLWQGLWLYKNRFVRLAVFIAFFTLLLGEVVRYQSLFLFVYPKISAKEWQAGYTEVAEYVQGIRDKYVFVYVDQFDDRFFLYYQPYSGLTFSEIQHLPSDGFKRDIYKNVRIRPIDDWLTLENNSVVITRPDRLPEGWTVIYTMYDALGKESFVVVETPRV